MEQRPRSGHNPGSQQRCLPGPTWLATYVGATDGEPLTIEGRSLPGGDSGGNADVALYLLVNLEISLANISYIEQFPWAAAGWRRRIVAHQVKVTAINTVPVAGFGFTVSASVQRGWAQEHNIGAYLSQSSPGLANPAAYLRVPQATVRFQASSLLGTSIIGFGTDDKPSNIARGVDGDAGAPTLTPFGFYPITQYFDEQPWPAWASVLWLQSPTAFDLPSFTFKA